jgi:hypothetical protein
MYDTIRFRFDFQSLDLDSRIFLFITITLITKFSIMLKKIFILFNASIADLQINSTFD